MASSRRTYNTDTITLRTIFAKDGNNSNIPAQRVLTADGVGGTYWAIPSTLGLNGGFNQIVTSAGNYTADLSYNTFRLSSGPGIGMTNGPTGSNQTNLFAKAFQQIDLSGGNLLAAFSNGYLYPTLKIAGEGSIQVRSDPTNNTFFIHGPMTVNTVSTGIYGFSQLQVIPSISTPISNANQQFGYYLTATSPSTLLTFAGINDIQLSTNVTTNTVFMSISSFTSKGYLALSGETFGAYGRATSTMSTNYVDKSTFVTTISSLSTNFGGISNVLFSTISWLALSTGLQFYTLTGLINARATIVQLNDTVLTISQQQTSTVKGLGSAGYISSIVISPSSITSTVQGLGTAGYISSLSLISTTQGLQYGYQTSGFVSSPNLIGHVSTAYLNTTLASTVQGLGSAGYISSIVISPSSITSTVQGLGTAGYISSLSLISTTQGLQYGYQTSGFVSSPNLIGNVSTAYLNTTLASTVKGLGSAGYLSTASGGSVPSNLTLSTLTVDSTIMTNTLSVSTMTTNVITGQGTGYRWRALGTVTANYSAMTSRYGDGTMACVNGGYIYYTPSFGASTVQQGTIQNWTGITCRGEGGISTSFACAFGGGIWKTTDTGTTWTITTAPTANYTCIVMARVADAIVAFSTDLGIIVSTNLGVNWTTVSGTVRNWTACCIDFNGNFVVAVVGGGGIYKADGTSFSSWDLMSGSPTGNWISVCVRYLSIPGVGYYFIAMGRNDGLNYSYNQVNSTWTILNASGYIQMNYDTTFMCCALPNTPIKYSFDGGSTFFTSSSPALNWSCISQNGTGSIAAFDVCLFGTNGSFLYGNILADKSKIIHAANMSLISPNTISLVTGEQNIYSGTPNFTTGTISLTTKTLYIPSQVYMYNPTVTTLVRQPFIQYGTATGLTGATGSTIVTLTYAYTSQTSFVPTATVANFPPAMVFTSTITSGTFMIGWSSIATGSQAFYWNTMGT